MLKTLSRKMVDTIECDVANEVVVYLSGPGEQVLTGVGDIVRITTDAVPDDCPLRVSHEVMPREVSQFVVCVACQYSKLTDITGEVTSGVKA